MHASHARVFGGCLALMVVASARIEAAPRSAPPAELIATVAIGPVTTLRGLQAYLEAITPGAGDGLSDRALRREIAEAIGVTSLDGIDAASWMHLLVVSTSAAPEIGLLAKVANAKALARGADGKLLVKQGWAVIGSKEVIDRAGTYALGTLATQPAPTAPSATVYLPQLLDRYQREVEAARQQLIATAQQQSSPGDRMTQMMLSIADGTFAVLGEIERVTVVLEASRDTASLDLALAPRPGSRLAAFVALQRPSDYGLLAKLPARTSTTFVGAGRIDAGPYHDAMVTLTGFLYGPGAMKQISAAMGVLMKATTGEFAGIMHMSPDTGMSLAQLFGVSDAAAADKAIVALLALFKGGLTADSSQMKVTLKSDPGTSMHDGVTVRGYTTSYDLSGTPPAQRKMMERMMRPGGEHTMIAAFDAVGAMAIGPSSLAEAGRVIDAARGKAARYVPSPAIADFLAGSRARKDSFAMMFDLSGLFAAAVGRPTPAAPGAPFTLSLGFADRNAHLRLGVPAAGIRAAVQASRP